MQPPDPALLMNPYRPWLKRSLGGLGVSVLLALLTRAGGLVVGTIAACFCLLMNSG